MRVSLTLLGVFLACAAVLMSGSPLLDTASAGLPLGNLIAAAALCALAGAATLASPRATWSRRIGGAALLLAVLWLPLSIALAGNLALNFRDGRGELWVMLTLAIVALALFALLWRLVVATLRRRHAG